MKTIIISINFDSTEEEKRKYRYYKNVITHLFNHLNDYIFIDGKDTQITVKEKFKRGICKRSLCHYLDTICERVDFFDSSMYTSLNYFGYYSFGSNPQDKTINALSTINKGDRWAYLRKKYNIYVGKKWSHPGDSLIFLLQDNEQDFSRYLAQLYKEVLKIQEFTDRKIVFRFHPMHNSNTKFQQALTLVSKLKNVEISRNSRLQEDLDRAYCCITHSSKAAVNSVVRGIPVICTSPDVTYMDPVRHKTYESINNINYDLDRIDWMNRMGYSMWNLEEIRTGEALNYIWK